MRWPVRQLVPGLAIPVLVGVPLWVETSWLVAVVALAGGAVSIVAILRASLSLATAGAVLALSSLALALRDSSSSASMLVVAVFGLALLLLADGTHRCKRLEGARATPSYWHRCMAWWMGRGAISLAIAAVITILAPLVAASLPQVWAPFVAGIGILMTFAAAVAFAWSNMED
jgi:hypothetical protein